jgi:hypothetical protein
MTLIAPRRFSSRFQGAAASKPPIYNNRRSGDRRSLSIHLAGFTQQLITRQKQSA